MPPDLLPEPLLARRHQFLARLARVSAALEQRTTRPTAFTLRSLLALQAMLKEEIRRLEEAWRAQGPGRN